MFQTLRAVTCGLLLVGFADASAVATTTERCASSTELDALTARALQTDLMVAALACDRRDDYNAFVRRYREALAAHGGNLRAYFARQYGRAGEAAMNRFVTKLANEASSASNANRALYCRSAGMMYEGLAGADMATLEAVIRNPLLAVRHGVAACGATASSAAPGEEAPNEPVRDLLSAGAPGAEPGASR